MVHGPYRSVFSMVRSGRGWSMVLIGPYQVRKLLCCGLLKIRKGPFYIQYVYHTP